MAFSITFCVHVENISFHGIVAVDAGNNMQKILLMRGLPASGKTTFSKELLRRESGKWKRINKDDLRSLLDDGVWSKENEKFIIGIRNTIASLALEAGYSIIIDDTNFSKSHINYFKDVAQKRGIDFEIKDFTDVPLQTCIERDLKRLNSVGKDVIVGMWEKYLKPKDTIFELLKQPDGVVDAIICDIDGSIAKMKDRSPFDWHRVIEDEVVEHVKEIVRKFSVDHKILMVSGRDSVCRPETKIWLDSRGIPYNELFMRDAGNNEKDYIIKERIYHEKIWPKYKVKFVIDDRPQVIRMWKGLGLNVLNVGDNVEF